MAVVATLATFSADARREPGKKVGVAFETLTYDFGNVAEDGTPVKYEFKYTNTGNGAVTLLWAKPSCGCTQPKYSRKPLMPGESATVEVTFQQRGWKGEVDKDVRMRFKNASGKSEDITVHLRGVVVPAE